jgi:hypothetical protein
MGSIHNKKHSKMSGMRISPEKSDKIAFLGQDLVRCKSVMDNKYLQVKNFKYLFREISHENKKGN